MTEQEMNELNKQFASLAQQTSDSPIDDFAGLSPNQMHELRIEPLGPGSVVQWQDELPPAALAKIPLLTHTRDLLTRLSNGDLALNEAGNLPTDLLREWKGQQLIAHTYSDADPEPLEYFTPGVVAWQCALIAGWLEESDNVLSLTDAGRSALAGTDDALLKTLFLTNFTSFNLGYADGLEDGGAIQQSTGFLLYLLLKFGREWQNTSFYGEAIYTATPAVADYFENKEIEGRDAVTIAVIIRYLDGLLPWYGLVRHPRSIRWRQRQPGGHGHRPLSPTFSHQPGGRAPRTRGRRRYPNSQRYLRRRDGRYLPDGPGPGPRTPENVPRSDSRLPRRGRGRPGDDRGTDEGRPRSKPR